MRTSTKVLLWTLGGIGILGLLTLANRHRVVTKLKTVRLGKYFTLDEFTKTSTGFDNIPPPAVVQCLIKLVKYIWDPFREEIGMPVTITSGYRSDQVNSNVPGSSSTSQHPKGEAGDAVVSIPIAKTGQTEAQAKKQAFAKIPSRVVTKYSLTENNVEPMPKAHDSKTWWFKLTNQTIIDIVRKLKLPYDQIIDEHRGQSRWVHISHKSSGTQRYAWLTRRDPGPTRPKEYETIKIGIA